MLAHLLPPSYKEEVVRWIKEDCPTIDVGGYVVGDVVKTASLLCKSPGVLAGVPFAAAVFEAMNVECIWMVEEGTFIDPTTSENGKFVVARIKGKCNNILLAERTALNILSRASGIASESRKAVAIKFEKKWHGHVAGTRKTTPGFKNVEKYALLVGGAATHRLDLSQMVMLKDNHIWSTGSISNAVRKAKEVAGFSAKIEVECQSVEEALEAASSGADIIMLDNFSSSTIHAAARDIKEKYPYLLIEASGGITTTTMGDYMSKEIDIISRGSLTQGYPCVDFSMKIDKMNG